MSQVAHQAGAYPGFLSIRWLGVFWSTPPWMWCYFIVGLPPSIKVSARVTKGEFSKFSISKRSDKTFQELSHKKNSTKKYYFSANVLDIEVYYTLIVLITRWQVLSFWSNFVCQHVTKQITRYSCVILSRNSCRKIGSNAFEKKEEIVSVFVCNGKAEEAEKIV